MICKDCGKNFEGEHAKGTYQLSEEILGYIARIECAGCKSKVPIKTIKEQGVEKWTGIEWTQALFCPGCSHLIKVN